VLGELLEDVEDLDAVDDGEAGLFGGGAGGVEEGGEEGELVGGDGDEAVLVAAGFELVVVGLDARDGAGAVVGPALVDGLGMEEVAAV
jgi:hypothetical protein